MDYAESQMDWLAVRLEVKKLRKETGVSLRKLRTTAGVDPSTVNRIEGVEKYPAHQPDLETLEKLVRGMGITLSTFFLRIEGSTGAELAATTTDSVIDGKTTKAPSHGAPVRPTSDLTDRDRQVIAVVGASIARAIEQSVERSIKARQQAAAVGSGPSDRTAPDRRHGR